MSGPRTYDVPWPVVLRGLLILTAPVGSRDPPQPREDTGLGTARASIQSVEPLLLRLDVTAGTSTPYQIGQGELPRKVLGVCPAGIALP
jgi:hypothetical protein